MTMPTTIDLLIRVTLVLAGALVLARLLRSSPAIARHRLWTVTFVLVLAMPLLAGRLPRIGVPGWVRASAASAPVSVAEPNPLATQEVTGTPGMVALQSPSSMLPQPRIQSTEPDSSGDLIARLPLLGWAMGSALMLMALAVGMIRAWHLRRNTTLVRSGRLHDRLIASCRLLRVRRKVRLALSDRIRSPLAGGILRPMVLLPGAALEWDDQLLDTVLRHELIHLRRHDTVQQLGARLAVAWYWFHPLAWISSARAALAREQACDEAVLALGTRPSWYARSLVELAEFGTERPLMPALARLHRPELEERVISILKVNRTERAPRRTVGAILAVTAWALAVAAAGPVAAQVPAPEPPVPPAPAQVIEVAPVAPRAPLVAVSPGATCCALASCSDSGCKAPITPVEVPTVQIMPLPQVVAPVPPRPVAVEVPLAPPAPPGAAAGCGSAEATEVAANEMSRRPRMVIRRELDGRKVCLSVVGKLPAGFKLTPLDRLPAGVVLTLAADKGSIAQRMVITGTTSGNLTDWSINGVDHAVDADATAWRNAMLNVLGRSVQTGAGAYNVHADLVRERAMVEREHAIRQGELARRQARLAEVTARQANSVRAQAALLKAQTVRQQAEQASVQARLAGTHARLAEVTARQDSAVGEQAARIQARAAQQQAELYAVQARLAQVVTRQGNTVREQAALLESHSARTQAELYAVQARLAEAAARTDGVVEVSEMSRPDAAAVARLKELIDRLGTPL